MFWTSKPSNVVRSVVLVLGCSLALAPGVFGQHKEQFAQAQKDNSAVLKQYTWKSRTELKTKGESKNVKLEQVRYDLDGKQQKTPIGTPPEQKAKQEGGRRRGRGRMKEKIIEKKKAEFAELMKSLGQLAGSYAHMPPDKMQAFAQTASVAQGQGESGDQVLIQGSNALVAGDTMSIWIDPASYGIRRIEIRTSFEGKPVHFTGEFQALTDGPTYPARLRLEYPDKEVELTVENYDYQKLGM
ncbi:MAG: hypothetical protein E2P02_31285 [Acidobacteria bacterium]|nr:MAG: hypothetical protein E2P02_31285 [Acidobacteriota bacterium]